MPIESALPKVVAIVTTYKPDEGVFASLSAIMKACPVTIVVDNGSPAEFAEILDRIEALVSGVVRQVDNRGLANALNVGVSEAIAGFNAEYVLTFDQDTQPDANYVEESLAALRTATEAGLDVALTCAGRNNDWTLQNLERISGVDVAVEALQSGFLLPVTTIERIGEFRDSFFIDCVEIEYMFRARAHGLHCVVASDAHIVHTVGDRIAVSLRSKQLYVFGRKLEFSYHGPLRRYYITRNRFILFGLYARSNKRWALRQFITETKIALLCLLFGPQKPRQVLAFWAGLSAALRGKEGKVPDRVAQILVGTQRVAS